MTGTIVCHNKHYLPCWTITHWTVLVGGVNYFMNEKCLPQQLQNCNTCRDSWPWNGCWAIDHTHWLISVHLPLILQAHLCLLQQGVFTTSAGVLSRRRTLIALFSCAPVAWHFKWATHLLFVLGFFTDPVFSRIRMSIRRTIRTGSSWVMDNR